MTVSLTSIIADLESKIANADSSSSLSDLLLLLNSAERLTGTKSIYDSSELLTSAAEEGSVKFQNDGSLRFYNGTNWDLLDDPSYQPNHTMGSTYGYTAGGQGMLPTDPSSPSYNTVRNIIDYFPFASDGNAADVGDLTRTANVVQSSSSQTHGYTAGGYSPNSNVIDKFAMTTSANATDVGDLTAEIGAGIGHSSTTHGYVAGGLRQSPLGYIAEIEKYSHSSDGNSADAGSDLAYRYSAQTSNGANSITHGYLVGSAVPAPNPNARQNIMKYPFANDAIGTVVSALGFNLDHPGHANSDTHGYAMGGVAPAHPSNPPSYSNEILKYSLTSDGTATDIGNLTQRRAQGVGLSSKNHGYMAAGYGGTVPYSNVIDKFPFAADTDATDVGDLTRTAANPGGNVV